MLQNAKLESSCVPMSQRTGLGCGVPGIRFPNRDVDSRRGVVVPDVFTSAKPGVLRGLTNPWAVCGKTTRPMVGRVARP